MIKIQLIWLLTFTFVWVSATKKESIQGYFDEAQNHINASNIIEALASYNHILSLDPNNFLAYFHCANLFFKNNQYKKAYDYYQKAIVLNPLSDATYFNMGLLKEIAHVYSTAITHYKQAYETNPKHHKALQRIAKLLKQEGHLKESVYYFHKILSIYPHHFESHYNLAQIYQELNTIEQSLYHYYRASQHKPESPDLLTNYANALNKINETKKALEIYKKVVELSPSTASAYYNVGYTLKKLNNIEASLPFFEKAVQLNPESSFMRFGISLAYLTAGDFTRGWKEYEHRWKAHNIPQKQFNTPMWTGQSLDGKTILLCTEQGLGDSFQFIRYAKVVKEMGATVIFQSKQSLVNILSLCPYIDQIIVNNQHASEQELPSFDYYAPLMSMPFLCGTTLQNIPGKEPYLYADETLIQHWQTILEKDKNFKIGVCWQGNQTFKTKDLQNVFSGRSIKLQYLQSLMNIEGISVYSLQKCNKQNQLQTLPNNCTLHIFDTNFDEAHGSFCDTAAIIKSLDLTITIDTSIAHLAGGLGAPVWVLLPNPPDFRWMTNIDYSPWYPTMKLFRQQHTGVWQDVIQHVTQELKQLAKKHRKVILISQQINKLKKKESRLKTKIKEKTWHIKTK